MGSFHAATTDTGLLNRCLSKENPAWIEFDRKYREMIRTLGLRHGLAEQDLDDLQQNVMKVCCERLEHFLHAHERGRFRTFLGRIVADLSRRMLREQASPPLPDDLPEYDEGIDRLLMQEYERFLLNDLLEHLKQRVGVSTYSAFEMLCVQGLPVEEVAAVTRKSRTSLYVIRHRCLAILRQGIRRIPSEHLLYSSGNSSSTSSVR